MRGHSTRSGARRALLVFVFFTFTAVSLLLHLGAEYWTSTTSTASNRRRLKVDIFAPLDVEDGIFGLVHNITVYAAVITNKNPMKASFARHQPQHFHGNSNSSSSSSSSSISSISRKYTSVDIHEARRENIKRLKSDLAPIPIVEWPAVHGKACPRNHNHVPLGHSLAHLQIWLDFKFFDNDVLQARTRPKPEFLSSSPFSSISGRFKAFENGSLSKNDLPFAENDILIILEDDSVSVVPTTTTNSSSSKNYNPTLTAILGELTQMTTDLLYLGWCETEKETPGGHKHAPLCTYAYAITRAAARKLSAAYDPCGETLDQQLADLADSGYITSRRAHKSSYQSHSSSHHAPYVDSETDPGPDHKRPQGLFVTQQQRFGSLMKNVDPLVPNEKLF